jgi:hypothetical protein
MKFNKTLKNIFLVVLLILLLVTIYYKAYNYKELIKEKESNYQLSSKQKEKILNGDIILRYGYGLTSDKIIKLFNEKFAVSHCGIIQKNNNQLFVIHSESSSKKIEGVYKQNFDEFCRESHQNSIIIVRFKELSEKKAKEIIKSANNFASKHTAFDYKFNQNVTTAFFCTEFVWHLLKKATHKKIFLDKNNKLNLLQFKHFYTSENFKVIVNEQEKKSNF